MRNYDLLMTVLKNWPINKGRSTRDFGLKLRQMARNGFPTGNIFQASEEENRKMLMSLIRLSRNFYGAQFPFTKEVGASGFTKDEIKQLLTDSFVEKHMKRIK